jgi:CRISPR/Cas system CSM-associated protein Csm3 (group 7 of RAMP superfamily)
MNKNLVDIQAGAGGIPRVTARYVITGRLILDSAAYVGNGEKGNTVDMPLLRDPRGDRVFLPGSSLGGALRSFAADYHLGYNQAEDAAASAGRKDLVTALFGGSRGDDDGDRSFLAVHDSYAENQVKTEIRDGVAIEPQTGTAAEGKKFDLEVMPSGTIFKLHLELVVPEGRDEAQMMTLLAVVLTGLENREIPLGARRTRGFGACHAKHWQVQRFDLQSREGWLNWLQTIPEAGGPSLPVQPHNHFADALAEAVPGFSMPGYTDRRNSMQVTIELGFPGGLLVRSSGLIPGAADSTQLTSAGNPVLPGTSLAGALRSRALRIARVVRVDCGDAGAWVEDVFGPALEDEEPRKKGRKLAASKLRVSENIVAGGARLRVNRVKIDRFTGGSYEHALFDEEPVYRGKTTVTLELRCPANATEADASARRGLVLLAVKDLITGDLHVGGTGSVGRGTAIGTARVNWQSNGVTHSYIFGVEQLAKPEAVSVLNAQVAAFHNAPARSGHTEGGGK